MIKVFEGFSGVGSQRMALRNIGADHEVVAIAEIDKYAIESYTAIHGEANNLGDISKLTIDEIPDHDLFTYSFPCQDISISGNKKGLEEGSGTRSSLLWECRRVIKGKRPKYLLLENVKNLVGKKNKADFDKWLFWLVEQGYTNYWKVVNAKHHGIPQNRERVLVVSILGYHEPFEFPTEIPLEKCLGDLLEPEVDAKYYLSQEVQEQFCFNPNCSNDLKLMGILEVEQGMNDTMKRVYSVEGICPTIMTMTGGNRQPKVLIKNNTKLGYLEAEHGDGIDLTRPTSTTRRGRVQKGMSQTITCADMLGVVLNRQPKILEIIKHDIPQPVRVRKHEVDVKGLQELLRNAKKESGLTITQISKELNRPKTEVEHWFRTDTYFSIPEADIWWSLTILLGIDTDEFDAQVTEFVVKEGVYEKANRCYDPQGIAPTLTVASADEKIIEGTYPTNYQIRKLTPLECWRLMGFSDEDYDKASAVVSNTQLYKQAGNSIVVNCLEGIFRQLFKEEK